MPSSQSSRPPCVLCDATEHVCTVCGTKTDAGMHRGLHVGGVFVQQWRCMADLYTDAAPPERYTASPTFIADPARAADVTRVVILHATTPAYYEIEETTDGRFWRTGLRSKLPRDKWKLDKVTP
jgi:hypothetical protein